MSWAVGDRVGWVGNNWGIIAAGPIDCEVDDRRFWWVVMEKSSIPTTVEDVWLRHDTRGAVRDGVVSYAKGHFPEDPPMPRKGQA